MTKHFGTSRWSTTLFGCLAAVCVALFAAVPAHAQYGYDYGWGYDGYYYDDDNYDDDWYYDYYDYNDSYYGADFGDDWRDEYYTGEYDELEYEPGEGLHEEEWYDPSDWFDTNTGISYEDMDEYEGVYDDGTYEDRYYDNEANEALNNEYYDSEYYDNF